MKPKVLLAMDNVNILKECKEILEKYDLETEEIDIKTYDAKKANRENVELMLVDVELCNANNMERFKRLRRDGNILIIAVHRSDFITIYKKCFNIIGIYDCICITDLSTSLAQIGLIKNQIKFKDLILDDRRYVVATKEQIVLLEEKEYKVLKFMIANEGQLLTREQIYGKVWGYDYFGDIRSVDVTIRRIREKLEDDPNNPKYIKRKEEGYYV